MSSVTHRPAAKSARRRDNSLARSWLSVASIPLFFFVGFALSEGLYALTGYNPGTEHPPKWADLVAAVPGLLVCLLPCYAAVRYGRRAARAGRSWGAVPVIIGSVVGLLMLLMTSVAT
jgi:hypothetical protein